MGFTSYSTPVQPADWVDPMDLNLYIKSNIYKQSLGEKNLKDISDFNTGMLNIPAIGQDKAKLMEINQKMKDEISNLNLSNLGDFNTLAQVKGVVNKYANDKDVLAIAKRSSLYQSELKRKQELEDKGKTYVSPLIRQANKYYNSGLYKTDESFNGSGFVAPDDKELDEIAKNTPEWENFVTKGRYDIHQKGKAEASLFNNYLSHFTRNSKWQALLNDQFEQDMEEVDIDQINSQGIQGIRQLFPYLPPDKQQEALQDLQEGISISQSNPYLKSAWKDKLRDDFFKNQAYMAAQAKTYTNTVNMKANEFAKSANDFNEAKQLAEFNAIKAAQVKTGILPEATDANGNYIYYTQDAKGNMVFNKNKYYQDLSTNVQAKDVEVAKAKSDITLDRQLQLQDAKTEDAKEVAAFKTSLNKKKEAEKLPTYTIDEVRAKFSNSSEFKDNFKQFLKDKNFDVKGAFWKGDIEAVEYDSKSGEYLITVDPTYTGSSRVIRVFKGDFNNLMEGNKLPSNVDISNPQEGDVYEENGEKAVFKNGKWEPVQ